MSNVSIQQGREDKRNYMWRQYPLNLKRHLHTEVMGTWPFLWIWGGLRCSADETVHTCNKIQHNASWPSYSAKNKTDPMQTIMWAGHHHHISIKQVRATLCALQDLTTQVIHTRGTDRGRERQGHLTNTMRGDGRTESSRILWAPLSLSL